MTPVTDPAILLQLNAPVPVTDPKILAALNSDKDSGTLGSDIVSAYGKANNFSDALQHNVYNPLLGIGQLASHALGAVGIVSKDRLAEADAAMAEREKSYQANTPDNAASYAGATVGSVAPFLLSDGLAPGLNKAGTMAGAGVSKILPEATPQIIKTALPKIANASTQGGLVAASNPVNNADSSFASQKAGQIGMGQLIGGAMPIAIGTGKALAGAVKPFTNPGEIVGEALSKWAGPDAMQKLNDAKELVPGSKPTTAQVLANPDIVQAEKALANNPDYKPKFMNNDIGNNQARLDAIQKVAGSPEAMQQAIKDRAAATADWTGPQGKLRTGLPVDVQPIINSLNKLQESSLSLRPTISAAAKDMISDLQDRSFQIQGQSSDIGGYGASSRAPRAISPADLDSMRQNARDYLAKHATIGNPVSSQQEAAFVPIKNAITDAIEQANPGYRDYLAKFAKYSAPINSMQAAQGILDNFSNRTANASGTPQVNLSSFNTQLGKALDTPYGISPEAETTLTGIQKDLQRGTISNSVKAPGSDTAYNLQAPGFIAKQLYGSEFGGPGKAIKVLAPALGVAASIHSPMAIPAAAGGMYYAANKLSGAAGSRVNNLLAEALLNPSKAAELLQKANIPKNSQLSEELLKRIPQLGGLTAK